MKQAHILRSVLEDLLPDHHFETDIQPDLVRIYFYKKEKWDGFVVQKIMTSDQDPNEAMDEAHWLLFKNVVKSISNDEYELSEF